MNRLGYLQHHISHGIRFFILYNITIYHCQGACIQPSCVKLNLSTACLFCENNGSELLGLKRFAKDTSIAKDYNVKLKIYEPVWIDSGPNVRQCNNPREIKKTCKSGVLNGSHSTFTDSPCSNEIYFFCYHNDSECGTCATPTQSTADTTATTTASVTTLLTSDSAITVSGVQHTAGKVMSIMVGLGLVCLVAIIIGVVCFLRKRRRKLKQYPVEEESACAMNNVKDPEPETEAGQGADQDINMDGVTEHAKL